METLNTTNPENAMVKADRTVEIPYRDCKIMYEVDMKSISEMAEHYGIEWSEMKNSLRAYGFTIRNKEPKPTEPVKGYTIKLTNPERVVAKQD